MLSLAHLTIGANATPLDVVDAAVAGQFDAIGLRLIPPTRSDTVFPLVGDHSYIKSLSSRIVEANLKVLDIEAIWIGDDTNVYDFEAALDVGALLGARHVLVLGNDPIRSRLIDNLGELARLAKRYGLKPALEWHPYVVVNTLQSAAEIISAVGTDEVNLLVDALHLYRSGGGPADILQVSPNAMPYWQLCDAPASAPSFDLLRNEARFDRRYPGDGGLDLCSLLQVMPPYSDISIEAPFRGHASLPPVERGRLCGLAAHAFLSTYATQF